MGSREVGCKSGRALGHKKEETRQLNSFLETMQSKIYEAQRELLNKGKEITITSVRNKLRGIGVDNEPKITILEVYRNHVEEVKALVGKEYALGTLKRFKSAWVPYSTKHQLDMSVVYPTAVKEWLSQEQSLEMISNGHP
jgi:hypothetical protein